MEEKQVKIESLEKKSQQEDFWSNPALAKEILRELDSLKEITEYWLGLQKETKDLIELSELGDKDLAAEIDEKFIDLSKRFKEKRILALFSGEYDANNAILSIHAGTGGVDAQDFSQMLERMFTRYAQKMNFAVNTLDKSVGGEAGIKKVVMEVKGLYAYGYLKAEAGIHRLVRLSPFNSDSLRQTSFALVEVIPEIEDSKEIDIKDEDLRIDTYRAQGHGGQGVNTTDSAVRLTHLPSKIVVTCQNERSQLQNKETAMKILRSKLIEREIKNQAEKKKELRGEAQDASFGNQIRSYVLHPYKLVKDHRTGYESKNVEEVLDGKINDFIKAYLEKKK